MKAFFLSVLLGVGFAYTEFTFAACPTVGPSGSLSTITPTRYGKINLDPNAGTAEIPLPMGFLLYTGSTAQGSATPLGANVTSAQSDLVFESNNFSSLPMGISIPFSSGNPVLPAASGAIPVRQITTNSDGSYTASIIGPNGSNFKFNSSGTLASIKYQNVAMFTFSYDSCNRDTLRTDYAGNTRAVTYNTSGNGMAATLTEAQRTFSVSQDSHNNLAGINGPLGPVASVTYDSSERPVTVVTYAYPGGVSTPTTTTLTYDGQNRVASYQITGQSNTTVSYGTGSTTVTTGTSSSTFTFDANGRLLNYTGGPNGTVAQTFYNQGSSATNIQTSQTTGGTTVTYSNFNSLGLAQAMSGGGSSGTFSFNSYGEMTNETLNGATVFSATYDSQGRTLTTVDSQGNQWTYTYDSSGFLKSQSGYGETMNNINNSTGQLVQQVNGSVTMTIAYQSASTAPNGFIGNIAQIQQTNGTTTNIASTTVSQNSSGTTITQTNNGTPTSFNLSSNWTPEMLVTNQPTVFQAAAPQYNSTAPSSVENTPGIAMGAAPAEPPNGCPTCPGGGGSGQDCSTPAVGCSCSCETCAKITVGGKLTAVCAM